MNTLKLRSLFSTPDLPVAVTSKFPQVSYPEHAHDIDEIVIVTSGQGIHVLNDKEFKARRGDVFYVQAGDRHLFESTKDLTLFNLLYCRHQSDIPSQLPAYMYVDNRSGHWPLQQQILERIERMIPRLDSECSKRDDATACMVVTLFSQILTYLWRGRSAPPSYGKRGAAKKIIVDILQFLDGSFSEELTLDHIGSLYALSERSLNRLFKEHTGLGPIHYLNQLRLCKAIELMRHSDSSVTDIAYNCGFNDSNYFSYCFRKKFGVPPRSFQKTARLN